MSTYNIRAAKTHLSKLLDDVAHGKEVLLAKSGKPIAKIVPLLTSKNKRPFGVLHGKIKIAKDFDAPLV